MKKIRGTAFRLVVASLSLGLSSGAGAVNSCYGGANSIPDICQYEPGSYSQAWPSSQSKGIRLDAETKGVLFLSYMPPRFVTNNTKSDFFVPQKNVNEFSAFLSVGSSRHDITVNEAVVPGTYKLTPPSCAGGSDLTWTLKTPATGISGTTLTVPVADTHPPASSNVIVDGYTLNTGASLPIGTTSQGASTIEWSATRTETSGGKTVTTSFVQDQQLTFTPALLKSAGWCWGTSALTSNCSGNSPNGYFWSGTTPATGFPSTTAPASTTKVYYNSGSGWLSTSDCTSKTPQNGACGDATKVAFSRLSDVQASTTLCSVGTVTPDSIKDTGGGVFQWACDGVNGGSTSGICASATNCWTCGSGELFGLGCTPTAAQLSNMCGYEAVGYMYDLYAQSNAQNSYNQNSGGYQTAWVDPGDIKASTQILGIKLFLSTLNIGTTVGTYQLEGGYNKLFPSSIASYETQYNDTKLLRGTSTLGKHQTVSADFFGACYDATWKPDTTGQYVFVAQADDMVVLTINGNVIGEYGGGFIPGMSAIIAPQPPEKPNIATWPNTLFGYYNSGNDANVYIHLPMISSVPTALVSFSQNRIEAFLNTVTVTQNTAYPVQIKFIQAYPTGMTLRLWAIPANKLSSLTGDAVRSFLSNVTNKSNYLMNLKAPTSITCPHQAGQ